MDQGVVKTTVQQSRKAGKKLLLIAGLSVQAWGVLMGLSLIVLNLVR